MAGGTTMVWYSLQTKKAAGQSDAETKPILTVNNREAEKIIIMNRNPADKNNILVYIPDTNGIETPYLRAEYADRPLDVPFKPAAFELEAARGFRRIFGNPPIRAAPEPRGPL